MAKIGRNDPCPCGSGKKYKNCCMGTERDPALHQHDAQEPGEALPKDLRAMERQTAKYTAWVNKLAAEHPDQINTLINSPDLLSSIPDVEPATPLEQAQELIYQAFEASGGQRVRLARQALTISPDCADAYVIQAEELAKSPRDALSWYEKGVAAGRRALGRRFFKDYEGEFWHMLETRPFMRAMLGKVETLAAINRHEESIELAEEMLRLNPGDNQGVRYLLLRELMLTHDNDGADDLLDEYPEDDSAQWRYGRALIKFGREGDSLFPLRALSAAYNANRFVPQYLLDYKELPAAPPPYYSIGEDSEAAWYAMEHKAVWRETPGALAWLKDGIKRLQEALDERATDDEGWTLVPDATGPNFFLNPSAYVRYTTRCPACGGPVRQRSRNLTVLLEPSYIVIDREDLRYCPSCDLLIAHADNVEDGLTRAMQVTDPDAIGNDYLVMGYIDAKVMRKRPDGPLDPDWAREHTVPFRSYRQYKDPWEERMEQAEEMLGDLLYGPADDVMDEAGDFDFSDFDRGGVDVVHELPASTHKHWRGSAS